MKETKIPQCLLLKDWENPNYSLTLIWNEMKTHLVLVTYRNLNSNKHPHRDKSMFFLPFEAVCLKQAIILLKPEIISGYECLLLIVTIFISSVLCFRVPRWSLFFFIRSDLTVFKWEEAEHEEGTRAVQPHGWSLGAPPLPRHCVNFGGFVLF